MGIRIPKNVTYRLTAVRFKSNIHRVTQKSRLIFWGMKVSIIVIEKTVHVNICVILNGYREIEDCLNLQIQDHCKW